MRMILKLRELYEEKKAEYVKYAKPSMLSKKITRKEIAIFVNLIV